MTYVFEALSAIIFALIVRTDLKNDDVYATAFLGANFIASSLEYMFALTFVITRLVCIPVIGFAGQYVQKKSRLTRSHLNEKLLDAESKG